MVDRRRVVVDGLVLVAARQITFCLMIQATTNPTATSTASSPGKPEEGAYQHAATMALRTT